MGSMLYGVAPDLQPQWFAPHLAGETLDYSLDISDAIDLGTDVIASVTASIAPSGAGEMEPTALTVNGTLLTLTVAGGQPERMHTILFSVVMTDGRQQQLMVRQKVAAVQITDQAPAAPENGFGAPMTWTYTPIIANGPFITLPLNAVIRAVYIQNTTANAVTGGINIGTTAGGSDVVAGLAIGPNATVSVLAGSLLIDWPSVSSPQDIYISAVTSWNGASLSIRVKFDE